MNESHAGLRSSERFEIIKTLATNLEIAVCFASKDGNVLFTNELFRKKTGYAPENNSSGCILENAVHISKNEFISTFENLENLTQDEIIIEDDFQFSDQGIIRLKFKATYIEHLDAIMMQVLDSQLLELSNLSIETLLQRYSSPLKIDKEFVVIINQDCKILGIDNAGLKMLESDYESVVGIPFKNLFDEGQIEHGNFRFDQFEVGHTHTREVWLKTAHNSRPFELMIRREFFADKEFLAIVARDISLRYSYEDRLNRTLEIFKIITTYSTDIICIFNENQDLVFMSPVITELTGYSVEELMTIGFHSTIMEEDRKTVQNIIRESVKNRNTLSRYKYRQLRKDGSHFWLEVNAVRRYDEEGRIIQTIANLRDVNDQVRTEEEIIRNEKLLIETQKLARLGSWSYIFEENRMYFGKDFAEMFGIETDFFTNPDNLWNSLVKTDFDRLVLVWENLTRNGLSFNIDLEFIKPDGEHIFLNTRAYPERDVSGNIVSVRGAVMDITARKETEKHLVYLKEKAESAARAKHQFLSNMSHELRTPMNAVLGLSSLLLEENPTQEQREKLEVLQFSAESLLHIIDDILDINALEENKLKLINSEFDLSVHLQNVISIFRSKADEKNIQLTLDMDELPATVCLDKNRLNQILYNLIGNALKFTDQGSVYVKAFAVEDSRVAFSIRDTGIGIPKEELQYIFERFYRANSGDNFKYSGTGLGLSICKKLLDMMGSDLIVESEIGIGTEFSFILDCNQAANSVKTVNLNLINEINHSQSRLRELNILVAEDNEVNQFLIKKILGDFPVNMTLVKNGLQAIDLFKRGDFEMLLLDLQMPIMDGRDAARIIKTIDADVPIIAMTASVIELGENIKSSGFDDYIIKPFKPSELKSLIEKYAQNPALSL